MKTHKSLMVIDPVTDASETGVSADVCIYLEREHGTVTVTDADIIRGLYDHTDAKPFSDGSYYIPLCVEIETEDDGRYLASLAAIPGLMAYGDSPESATLAMFARGVARG